MRQLYCPLWKTGLYSFVCFSFPNPSITHVNWPCSAPSSLASPSAAGFSTSIDCGGGELRASASSGEKLRGWAAGAAAWTHLGRRRVASAAASAAAGAAAARTLDSDALGDRRGRRIRPVRRRRDDVRRAITARPGPDRHLKSAPCAPRSRTRRGGQQWTPGGARRLDRRPQARGAAARRGQRGRRVRAGAAAGAGRGRGRRTRVRKVAIALAAEADPAEPNSDLVHREASLGIPEQNPLRSPRTDRPVPMPLLSAPLAVHAYSAPLAGRPAVTRAAAGGDHDGRQPEGRAAGTSTGIPFESREIQLSGRRSSCSRAMNEIKLLTAVSEAGLLSGAEEAGVFSKGRARSLIEKTLPLVEKLGLLSALETAKEVEAGLTITLGGFIFFFTPGTSRCRPAASSRRRITRRRCSRTRRSTSAPAWSAAASSPSASFAPRCRTASTPSSKH